MTHGYAEYRDLGDTPPARVTVHATARTCYPFRLEAVAAGWEPAGSMARLVGAYWAIRFTDARGATHGRRFATEAEARREWANVERLAAREAAAQNEMRS